VKEAAIFCAAARFRNVALTPGGFSGDQWGGNGKRWETSSSRGLGFSQIFRTGILMAGLIALLVLIGRMVGGYQGMVLFGAIGVLFNFGAWWFSDKLALAAHRAQPADPSQHGFLFDIVQELSDRAGMPMPRVYIIPTMTPNAFATGRNPEHAAVAVTAGILRILNRRELRGVIAHELAHVRNRDTLISTIAASIAGLISAVGSAIRWGMILGGGRRDDERGGGGLEMLVMAIVAPIVAMLVQLAISRSREYGADETGAKLCGDPDALADALVRLEQGVEAIPYEHAGLATAHLFIVNPFSGRSIVNLLSTHPPMEERVARLRQMAGTM
jgi:heat shock protein HtpX